MSLPDSLQTIAEVSIAFAGFSGLVVALRKKAGPLTDIEKYRLQVLLTMAFGAMFLSFLPEVLGNFGLDMEDSWSYSGLVLCFYSLIFLSWWIRATRKFINAYSEIFSWSVFARMVVGHIGIIMLQLAAFFTLVPVRAAAAFVVALIWYLIHAAQQFVRMLFVQPGAAISKKT